MGVVQLLTLNETDQDQKFITELENINKRLNDRENEVIELQKKVIELFEELRYRREIA